MAAAEGERQLVVFSLHGEHCAPHPRARDRAGGALGLLVDNVDGILPVPAERAFGDVLPGQPAPTRRRRTSSARPRTSS